MRTAGRFRARADGLCRSGDVAAAVCELKAKPAPDLLVHGGPDDQPVVRSKVAPASVEVNTTPATTACIVLASSA